MATTIRTVPIPSPARGARHLAENETAALPRGRGAAVVRVERGTVLVTQEGDLDDHVLEPGDEIVLRRGGLAVAWAFTEALIWVGETPEGARRACGGDDDERESAALARPPDLEQVGMRVAHELKNPLSGVKALVQLGLRNPAEIASHERLEVIEREVTRMQDILQSYLSLTRPLEEVRVARVELGPLVSDTLAVLSARAHDARVRLRSRGDATIDGDPRRLEEALLNLVANAIEATPPGGEVSVEVRPADDRIEIAVRDTGRGMPSETLRRLGTPFFTTREDGTGLGVALARSVLALHGGSLRYESESGKGTTAWATLPTRVDGGRGAASIAAG